LTRKAAGEDRGHEVLTPATRRPLGRCGLEVPVLGFGGAPLGNLYEPIPEERARQTVAAALEAGIRLFDTAPWYGHGLSEHRLGAVLRGVERASFVLSTKVGRRYRRASSTAEVASSAWPYGLPFMPTFDYTAEGLVRSYEDSLVRLGLRRVDALLVHDLDRRYHGEGLPERLAELVEGWPVLEALRAGGEVAALGFGINEEELIETLVDRFRPDFLLVAMPYTLLDQRLPPAAVARCRAGGVKLVIGSPYASGVLARGSAGGSTYGYGAVPEEITARIRALERLCAGHGVPLRAAALQFVLAHPDVSAVVPGPSSPEEAADNAEMLSQPIPDAFWAELRRARLVAEDSPLPIDRRT
jgi:D-threo-aldose 1-dehydrogenase